MGLSDFEIKASDWCEGKRGPPRFIPLLFEAVTVVELLRRRVGKNAGLLVG